MVYLGPVARVLQRKRKGSRFHEGKKANLAVGDLERMMAGSYPAGVPSKIGAGPRAATNPPRTPWAGTSCASKVCIRSRAAAAMS